MCQHVALVFGTRPEAIKLFPVIYALRERAGLRISVLVTGQHRAMLDQVLAIADISPDVDLNIMIPNQTLDGLTARLLLGIGEALDAARLDVSPGPTILIFTFNNTIPLETLVTLPVTVPPAAPAASVKFAVIVAPPVTVTFCVTLWNPLAEATSCTVPTGTPASV